MGEGHIQGEQSTAPHQPIKEIAVLDVALRVLIITISQKDNIILREEQRDFPAWLMQITPSPPLLAIRPDLCRDSRTLGLDRKICLLCRGPGAAEPKG